MSWKLPWQRNNLTASMTIHQVCRSTMLRRCILDNCKSLWSSCELPFSLYLSSIINFSTFLIVSTKSWCFVGQRSLFRKASDVTIRERKVMLDWQVLFCSMLWKCQKARTDGNIFATQFDCFGAHFGRLPNLVELPPMNLNSKPAVCVVTYKPHFLAASQMLKCTGAVS